MTWKMNWKMTTSKQMSHSDDEDDNNQEKACQCDEKTKIVM